MSDTHLQTFNNRATLARSSIAGCYSCLGTFKPQEVVAWVHDDTTAVCPICDADTVLPGVGNARALHAARAAQYDNAETVPAVLSLLPERN